MPECQCNQWAQTAHSALLCSSNWKLEIQPPHPFVCIYWNATKHDTLATWKPSSFRRFQTGSGHQTCPTAHQHIRSPQVCRCTSSVNVVFGSIWQSIGHVQFCTWLPRHCGPRLSCSSQLPIRDKEIYNCDCSNNHTHRNHEDHDNFKRRRKVVILNVTIYYWK